MKYFWIGLVAFTLGCSNSPTSPSSLNRASAKNEAQSIEKGGWFDPKQLGHATFDGASFTVGLKETPGVCYQRDFFLYHGAPLFIVWDMKDGANQLDVAHYPFVEAHFTLSDFQNGPIAADNTPWCIPSGPPPLMPPPPPLPPIQPPPPPVVAPICSAQSFNGWSHKVNGDGTETEIFDVKKGFNGIVAYMVSWGVPARFDFGVPLPQTQLDLVIQILHEGLNYLKVKLASSKEWPAFQMESGCDDKNHPIPLILTSAQRWEDGGQIDWLDDDGANIDE